MASVTLRTIRSALRLASGPTSTPAQVRRAERSVLRGQDSQEAGSSLSTMRRVLAIIGSSMARGHELLEDSGLHVVDPLGDVGGVVGNALEVACDQEQVGSLSDEVGASPHHAHKLVE